MTRCDNIQVLLALRPEDRSVTEERRVRAHLAVCVECTARAEAYAEQDRAIRSAPRIALTPSQRGQLLSTIERKRRRHEMRSKLVTVAGTAVAITAVIALVVGAKLLAPSDLQLIPGAPSHPPRESGSTVRLRGVDFAVLDHELTGCVTLVSGEEQCPPEDARYVWVKLMVENSEHYPTADNGPQLSIVHQGQQLPGMVFLPEGRSPLSACTPEGYYADDPCEFWIGASVPEGVASGDLTVQASWGDKSAVWPLGDGREARVVSAGQFAWPTRRWEISGWTFHDPRNPTHAGIDITAEVGDPVSAIADGLVTEAEWQDDWGNTVIVDHGDGWSSTYAKLEETAVAVGQTVSQGELVGRAGSTGESNGPKLHFELHYHGQAVNPLDYLPSQLDLRDLLLQEEELPGSAPDGPGADYWKPAALPLPDLPDGEDWIPNLASQEAPVAAFRVEGPRVTERQDGSSAVAYVMNAVYAFETPGQASRGYEALLAQVASETLGSVETLYDGTAEGGTKARAVRFEGSEGDAVYWLFGVKEQHLHLLMVNGLDDDATRAFFEATMAQVLTRGND